MLDMGWNIANEVCSTKLAIIKTPKELQCLSFPAVLADINLAYLWSVVYELR